MMAGIPPTEKEVERSAREALRWSRKNLKRLNGDWPHEFEDEDDGFAECIKCGAILPSNEAYWYARGLDDGRGRR